MVIRPLITEKATHLSERHNAYTFEVNPLATKTEIKQADRGAVQRQGGRRPHPEPPRQGPPAPAQGRPDAELEEGDRHACTKNTGSISINATNPNVNVGLKRWVFDTTSRPAPGARNASVSDFSELTDKNKKPEKSLTEPLQKTGGRNNQGFITARHRGGGHKRMYRIIDFRRNDHDGTAGPGDAHRVRPEPLGADRA